MKLGGPKLVSRDLLGEQIAEVLRRQIIGGEIAVGTRLIEDDLAAKMGTSRGPLRDALTILAVEGLVSGTPGKGTYVKGLTEENSNQLFDVRAVLEGYAARLATIRIQPEQEKELRRLVEEMEQIARQRDLDHFVGLDLRIHRSIWEISGNDRLVDILDYLITPCSVLIRLNAETYSDWSAMVELHRSLVTAIASRNEAEATRAMQIHLDSARKEAMHALKSRGGGS